MLVHFRSYFGRTPPGLVINSPESIVRKAVASKTHPKRSIAPIFDADYGCVAPSHCSKSDICCTIGAHVVVFCASNCSAAQHSVHVHARQIKSICQSRFFSEFCPQYKHHLGNRRAAVLHICVVLTLQSHTCVSNETLHQFLHVKVKVGPLK